MLAVQKVPGSSLTEADILRGSAFKFQIGQISTHLNEYYPVVPCRRTVPCRAVIMRDRNEVGIEVFLFRKT